MEYTKEELDKAKKLQETLKKSGIEIKSPNKVCNMIQDIESFTKSNGKISSVQLGDIVKKYADIVYPAEPIYKVSLQVLAQTFTAEYAVTKVVKKVKSIFGFPTSN